MKTSLKNIALFMAFVMLLTSCYTTRINSSKNTQDELREYISKLEPGDKIGVIINRSHSMHLKFRSYKADTLEGRDSKKVVLAIPITSIQEIQTLDKVKTVGWILVIIAELITTILIYTDEEEDLGTPGDYGPDYLM